MIHVRHTPVHVSHSLFSHAYYHTFVLSNILTRAQCNCLFPMRLSRCSASFGKSVSNLRVMGFPMYFNLFLCDYKIVPSSIACFEDGAMFWKHLGCAVPQIFSFSSSFNVLKHGISLTTHIKPIHVSSQCCTLYANSSDVYFGMRPPWLSLS